MSNQPSISVIMPCYNEANRITDSVESVFQQTFSDFELIIVDDGSSDHSLKMLAELKTRFPALRYFPQANQGAGPARNKGLQKAKGEMIAFLDADDSWHPDCLLKLHQALAAAPEAAIAYCGWQNIGLAENRCKPYIPPDYETTDKIEKFLSCCPWPIHAALTKHKAIKQVGGFDEQWTSCMDYDLWLRVASFNKVQLVPEVLAFYHHHDGIQITKNRSRVAINHWRVQRNFIAKHAEVKQRLGSEQIKKLTYGELLRRGYISYWDRDLDTAQKLFRKVLQGFYFKTIDLKYLLPSLLPKRLYITLVTAFDNDR